MGFMSKFASKFKKKKEATSYVSIIGDKIDPEHGIELKLDWNDEFIAYLKANGFTGTSDELIIQKWLHFMSLDVEQRIQDKTRNVSEFQ